MKKIILFVLGVIVSMPIVALDIVSIQTSQASSYVGENVSACGQVSQVKYFKSGVYLNFDETYPNQSMTGVLWQDTANEYVKKFGPVEHLVRKSICINGQVKKFNGKPQISVNNLLQISID